MRAVDEVHLAEDVIGLQRAEDLRAEGRVLADVDLSLFDDVEVHRPVFGVKDVIFVRVPLDAREAREAEDLLVFHVLEDGQLPQVMRDGDEILALLLGTRDLVNDLLQVLAALEAEEVLLAELQPLGRELELLDALLDAPVERLRVDAVDALERVDHPPHRLRRLAFLIGGEEKRVDEVVERAVEVFQLELDAPGDLGESAVERIELARHRDLVVREVPFALRVVQAAEDLEGAIVVRRLQLGDLEQLDGLRGLILGHVVLREADVLRRVDLIAPAITEDLLLDARVSRFFGFLFLIAHAREIDAQRDRARLELLGHLVEMDRLVVHPLIGVAPREREQVVRLDRNRRLGSERAKPRASDERLLSHGTRYYMKAEGRRQKQK